MEVQKMLWLRFGFPRSCIDAMTFYLSQPLNFEATEEIFLEASYAITAMVGALARSLKLLVLLREGMFYWTPPRSYLIWQLLHIVRELACKKYSLWLELSASNTDINCIC